MKSYSEKLDEIMGVRITNKESLEIKKPLIDILIHKEWSIKNGFFEDDDFQEYIVTNKDIQQASAIRKYPVEKQRKEVFKEVTEDIMRDIKFLISEIDDKNKILKLNEARLNQPKNNWRDIPF